MAKQIPGKKAAKKPKIPQGGLPKAAPVDGGPAGGGFRSTVKAADDSDRWSGAVGSFVQSAVGVWQNLIPLLAIVLVYGLISFAQPPQNLDYVDYLVFSYRQVMFAVIVLASAWPVYALAVADKRQLPVGEWLAVSARRYLPALLVTTITMLAIIMSSFLLFVPLLLLGPWICMATYVAVDPKHKDIGLVGAFRESYCLTRHHKLKVWYVFGTMILVILALGALFTPLAYLIEWPVVPAFTKAVTSAATVLSSCSLAMLYRWLQRNVEA